MAPFLLLINNINAITLVLSKMAIVFKPLSQLTIYNKQSYSAKRIFLAGSIDMGSSIDWQDDLTNKIGDRDAYIFNPRRDEWDASWEQHISNDNFRNQVEWELDNLTQSDIIVFNILPESKSPITLMEIGLFIKDKNKKFFVCCPPEFYRSGNVQVVCARYGIPLYEDYDKMTEDLLSFLDDIALTAHFLDV